MSGWIVLRLAFPYNDCYIVSSIDALRNLFRATVYKLLTELNDSIHFHVTTEWMIEAVIVPTILCSLIKLSYEHSTLASLATTLCWRFQFRNRMIQVHWEVTQLWCRHFPNGFLCATAVARTSQFHRVFDFMSSSVEWLLHTATRHSSIVTALNSIRIHTGSIWNFC